MVNDAAERGVKLAKDFNNKVTSNDNKNGLYQVVSLDRKNRNKFNKSELY